MSSQVSESKRNYFVGRDHITNLSDSLITHILSRLPTKHAVQTSVLSKDWKFKWHSIYNVNVTDTPYDLQLQEYLWKYYTLPDIYKKKELQRGKTANLLKAIKNIPLSHNVTSFTVYCWGSFYTGRLNAWISAVINPQIETFRLLYPWTCVVIPQNLFKCTSLRNLELKLPCVLRFAAIADSFANLIDLTLHSVEILNEDISTGNLIFKFEVLKTFKLYHCNFSNVKFFEVQAPKLTTFKWFYCCGLGGSLIKIFGAQLTCFEIHDNLNCVLPEGAITYSTLRCVVSDQQDNLEIRKVFDDVSTVKRLMLPSNTLNGIIIKQPSPLPSFQRLERLGIQFLGNLEGLLELLRATPVLRFLDMDRCTVVDGELEAVPSCVSFFLEEIKFNWDSFRSHRFQVEKFLLKNATQLKKVTLQFKSEFKLDESRMHVKQLLRCPRAASSSMIIVIM